MTIPNIISIFRIFLVPAFCGTYFNPELRGLAFVILIVSGVSDIADGIIARKFNQISRLGKVLDPLADKLFHLSTVFCLCLDDIVGWWLLVLMLSKDLFMIVGGTIFYKKTHAVIASKWYGKLSSSLLFSTFVIAFFLNFAKTDWKISTAVVTTLFVVAMVFSILSVINYTRAAVKINNKHKKEKGI